MHYVYDDDPQRDFRNQLTIVNYTRLCVREVALVCLGGCRFMTDLQPGQCLPFVIFVKERRTWYLILFG